MSTGTPIEEFRLYELGDRSVSLQGRIPLAKLDRFGGLVASPIKHDVQFALKLSRDEGGKLRVRGDVSAAVNIVCQRCLETVPVDILARIDALVVRTGEQAQEILPHNDVIVIEQEQVSAAELIEDDLILMLPEFGCERDAKCPHRPQMGDGEAAPRASPFGQLGNLLNKQ